MTLGERIKKLRRESELTQQEFCSRIGLKRNSISLVESGKRNISDQTIKSICREFNVSEEWLRTGEGAMFIEPTTFSLDKYAAEHGATDLELAIAKAYFDLPPGVRAEMLSTLKNLLNSVDDIPSATVPEEKTLDEEADKFAAIAREQFISERKTGSQVSFVKESDAG